MTFASTDTHPLAPTRARRWARRAAITAAALLLAAPALAQFLRPDAVLTGKSALGRGASGKIVVADRGSSTASVIDVATDTVIETLNLPGGDNPAEPMYVWYSPIGHRFFIGDRANDRVVYYAADTLAYQGEAATGAGVFHMWGSPAAGQLWVNNDVDNTTSVIDLFTLDTLASVPIPADLVAMGGKPHDVILSPDGAYAYVTVVAVDGPLDWVVQYDTATFLEIGRVPVGDDAHLSLTQRNNLLYVPCQGDGTVYVFDRDTLASVDIIAVPGAHGAGITYNGRYFYTTNLPGGGADALWTIDTDINEVVGAPVDSPHSVPHNIAIAPGAHKLYLTHSGMNDTVTIYTISDDDPTPVYLTEVTVGVNPFGLAWISPLTATSQPQTR